MFCIMLVASVLVVLARSLEVIGVSHSTLGRGEKEVNHRHRHGGGKRDRRDIIDRDVEDYLTKFGYLPQSDLETGMLRTLEQLEDSVRNLQGFAGINMTGKIDQQTKRLRKDAVSKMSQ